MKTKTFTYSFNISILKDFKTNYFYYTLEPK